MSIFRRMFNLFKPGASKENKWVCMLDQVISNQPGACPKCGRQLVPRVEIDITFTDEEKRAIGKERESWNSAAAGEVTLEPGQRLIVHHKMANAIDAFGLIAYVQQQVSLTSDIPEKKKRLALREAIKSQAKAYVLYDLPYFLYLWASLCEDSGDEAQAKRLYTLFLDEQSKFKPDKVDANVISYLESQSWFDVESAIQYARQVVEARLARRAEKRGREIFDQAEGSDIERVAIMGLMTAIEADEVVGVREKLKPDAQMIFMMAFECCMMWAIKSGIEKVLKPEQVQSGLLAMKRYLAQHGWYEPEAFEKIWAQTKVMMPIAMNTRYGPDAPPPYPLAEMLIGLDQAGYSLPMAEKVKLSDVRFGLHMLGVMVNLTQASRSAAQDPLQSN